MAERDVLTRAARFAAIVSLGFSLIGCESLRQATGAAKLPPDEFTVLTKAPLIIPPDYNLRPPQPGVASRNEIDADDQARAALFPANPTTAAAALGAAYSDGEKLLLAKTNALAIDQYDVSGGGTANIQYNSEEVDKAKQVGGHRVGAVREF